MYEKIFEKNRPYDKIIVGIKNTKLFEGAKKTNYIMIKLEEVLYGREDKKRGNTF